MEAIIEEKNKLKSKDDALNSFLLKHKDNCKETQVAPSIGKPEVY